MVRRAARGCAAALAAGLAHGAEPPAAFVEFELSHASAYVRQQVTATARLFTSEQVLTTALDDPAGEGLVVRSLEDVAHARVVRNGVSYDLLTRRYALFPQHAGTLTVRAPVLRGGVNRRAGPALPFGGALPTHALREFAARAPARPLEVLPAAAPGAWLPAAAVRLFDEWTVDGPGTVGQPLVRTVKMEVEGQLHTQVQLPGVAMPEGFRIYPDPPQGATAESAGGLSARWEQRLALVPQQPGTYELEGVRVQWWDVAAGALRETRTPTRTLLVVPAPAPAPGAGDSPAATGLPPPGDPWRTLALAALIGWGLTLALWWRRRRAARAGSSPAAPQLPAARRRLGEALGAADPAALRRALIEWARVRFAAPRLVALRGVGDASGSAALALEVRRLDAALYGRRPQWDARPLRAALAGVTSAERPSPAPALAPLYPFGSAADSRPAPRPRRVMVLGALALVLLALAVVQQLPDRAPPLDETAFAEMIARQEPVVLATLQAFEQVWDAMHPDDAVALQQGLARADGRLEALLAELERRAPPPGRAHFSWQWGQALRALERAHDGLTRAGAEDFLTAFFASRAAFVEAVVTLHALQEQLPIVRTYWELPSARPPAGAAAGEIQRHAAASQRGAYALYVPQGEPPGPRPLLVVLHGSHGSDLSALLTWVRPARSEGWLVLAPKSLDETWPLEEPARELASLDVMIEEVSTRHAVDARRVFLTGLSDGATFAYLVAAHRPGRFAALAPVAGVLMPEAPLAALAGVPTFIVHGARDFVFPVATAAAAYERLRDAGARDVRLEVVPDWGHALTYRINERLLLPWLHRLPPGE